MTLEFLAAEKIAEVAFGAAVEFGVGKLAEGAIAKVKTLQKKIKGKLQGNPEAEAALATVESSSNVEVIVPYLTEVMESDRTFAEEISNLARPIYNQVYNQQQENNSVSVVAQDDSDVQVGDGNRQSGDNNKQVNLGDVHGDLNF